jgi:signal transduction histidine kinase
MILQAQVMLRQLARDGLPSLADLEARFATFVGLATHMTALIDDLDEHARTVTDPSENLDLVAIDLVTLIEECLDQARQSGASNPIILETSEREIIGVWDRSQLQRVLENVVANAVKYSPGGEPIHVTVTRQDDRAVIAIADQGLGIPAADIDDIFAFRRRGSNVGAIAGSGVGLASVRQIVERHGGVITVQSTEGIGSTFTITLPLGHPTS